MRFSVAATVAGLSLLFSATAFAGPKVFKGPILIDQGGKRTPIFPIVGKVPVVQFYKYGRPAGASANTKLEIKKTSQVFFYVDQTTGKVSLVVIHDKANNGSGGVASVQVNGVPSGATYAVRDDATDARDKYAAKLGTFSVRHAWNGCCTDGFVIENLGNTFDLNLSATFTRGISAWKARSKQRNGKMKLVTLNRSKALRLVTPGAPAGRK